MHLFNIPEFSQHLKPIFDAALKAGGELAYDSVTFVKKELKASHDKIVTLEANIEAHLHGNKAEEKALLQGILKDLDEINKRVKTGAGADASAYIDKLIAAIQDTPCLK